MYGKGAVNFGADYARGGAGYDAFAETAGRCGGKTGCGKPCVARLSCTRENCGGQTSCGRPCADKSDCGRLFPPAEKHKNEAGIAQKSLKQLKLEPADIVYIYDGSLPGFYCCVHEAVYGKQLPMQIVAEAEAEPTLFDVRLVRTDGEKARRVRASIPQKISPRALELVEAVFLTCMEQKELAVLKFLALGYCQGPKTPYLFGHEAVEPLLKAESHMMGETHLLKGFVRFSDAGGVLVSKISPKNFVLPFLAEHFVGRYSNENFLIYDKTHQAALVYQDRQAKIIPLEGIAFPEAGEEEESYRALWKRFYKTVSIEARENPRCRMTHMPKRYWENMTEMVEFL